MENFICKNCGFKYCNIGGYCVYSASKDRCNGYIDYSGSKQVSG